MMHLSYKGGCGICECTHIEVFKTKLAWAIGKWLQVINNTIIFKQ